MKEIRWPLRRIVELSIAVGWCSFVAGLVILLMVILIADARGEERPSATVRNYVPFGQSEGNFAAAWNKLEQRWYVQRASWPDPIVVELTMHPDFTEPYLRKFALPNADDVQYSAPWLPTLDDLLADNWSWIAP